MSKRERFAALLRSPHAPLILSFLSRVFVEDHPGANGIPAGELAGRLSEEWVTASAAPPSAQVLVAMRQLAEALRVPAHPSCGAP